MYDSDDNCNPGLEALVASIAKRQLVLTSEIQSTTRFLRCSLENTNEVLIPIKACLERMAVLLAKSELNKEELNELEMLTGYLNKIEGEANKTAKLLNFVLRIACENLGTVSHDLQSISELAGTVDELGL